MTNYDMCLNSSLIGIDGCVDIIKTLYMEKQNHRKYYKSAIGTF